jgi:hypothetical protein
MRPIPNYSAVSQQQSLASPTMMGTYNDSDSDDDDTDALPDLTGMMPPQMQVQQAMIKLTELHNEQKKLQKQLKKQKAMIQQVQYQQSMPPPQYIAPQELHTQIPSSSKSHVTTAPPKVITPQVPVYMQQPYMMYNPPIYPSVPQETPKPEQKPNIESEHSLEFYKMQHQMLMQLLQTMGTQQNSKDNGMNDLEREELNNKINKLSSQLEKLKNETKFNEYPAFNMPPGYYSNNMYRGPPPYYGQKPKK